MSVNIYDKENNKLIRTADMLVEGGGGGGTPITIFTTNDNKTIITDEGHKFKQRSIELP